MAVLVRPEIAALSLLGIVVGVLMAFLPARVAVGGGGRGLGGMMGDSSLGGVPTLWGGGAMGVED